MLFTSVSFFIFFPIAVAAYFLLPRRYRWLGLLIAGSIFYMTFVPAYILILLFMSVANFAFGVFIEILQGNRRNQMFGISILINLSLLIVFKYADFLNSNLAALMHLLHWSYPIQTLSILLPIGLSFQIFQALSYLIEVQRGHYPAERHLGIYTAYTLFFPVLLAGPIERPQNLLRQFHEELRFDYQRITDGLKLMVWGLFKKAVIADRLAIVVNQVYGHPSDYQGIGLILATVLFAYQIYSDFSGYSDIAVGAAQVLGFRLTKNFNSPYVSRSITEFWQRWHISLSSWIRDYLYFPIARAMMRITNRRLPRVNQLLVSIMVMALVGLWHGADWTFVIWGTLHGVYLGIEGWLRPKTSQTPAATLALWKFFRDSERMGWRHAAENFLLESTCRRTLVGVQLFAVVNGSES